MAVSGTKLSQILPAAPGSISDQIVGVKSGSIDALYSISQVISYISGPGGPNPANVVNVLNFGTTFDDVQIQAAIDSAFNQNISRVIIPFASGQPWTINNPIFQDPPGNLRGTLTKAQILAGQTAVPIINGPYVSVESDWGNRFNVTFDTAPGWWIGTGTTGGAASNRVVGVNLTNTVIGGNNPKNAPVNCTGFAIASGGAAGTVFEACSAHNFYSGFRTGQNENNGSLAEGNKWLYCSTMNCYHGIWFNGGQGLVNTVFHCNIAATRSFRSNGPDYIVIGGEHGQTNSFSAAVSISSTSTLSGFTDVVPSGTGFFTNFTFTTTIANPDANWNACPDGGFIYNYATLNLPGFGIVPLILVGFNQSNNIATFQLWTGWTWMHFNQEVVLNTGTDFNTQLQAATTLYAVQTCVYFEGPGHLIHCHYENASVTALYDAPGDFVNGVYTPQTSSNGGSVLVEDLVIGSDIIHGSTAQIYASQAFPWIRQTTLDFTMRDCSFEASFLQPRVMVEGSDLGTDANTVSFTIERCKGFAPNLRYVGSNGDKWNPAGPGYDNTLTSLGNWGSKAFGFGDWDRTPWAPYENGGTPNALSYSPRAGGTSTTKYIGYKPAPGTLQRLTAADIAAIKSPAGPGLQQMICSNSLCILNQLGSQASSIVKDINGDGFSYYSTLTVSWSYDGQTQVVTISGGTHADWMFPGLEIGLNNGSGVVWYIVTGTYPTLGYITVYQESATASVLAGTKGTTYTGTIMSQRTASLLGSAMVAI